MTLPLHVVELLEHAARHPAGGLPLLDAQLECTAALYQVPPRRVEQARCCLTSPEARAKAEAILREADATPQPCPAPEVPAPRDANAVIEAAAAMPMGLDLLTRAPVETAAILLQAHPFVIEEARTLLNRSNA